MWKALFLVVFVCLDVRILLLHGHACEQPQMVIVAVRARKLVRGFLGCSNMPIACSILLFMKGRWHLRRRGASWKKGWLCWYVVANVCRAYWHASEVLVNCASIESDTVTATRLASTTAQTVDPVQDCADAEASALKTFGLIDTMGSWLIFARRWPLTTSAKKDGLREIAQTTSETTMA